MSALDWLIISGGPAGVLAIVAAFVFFEAEGPRVGLPAAFLAVALCCSCMASWRAALIADREARP